MFQLPPPLTIPCRSPGNIYVWHGMFKIRSQIKCGHDLLPLGLFVPSKLLELQPTGTGPNL